MLYENVSAIHTTHAPRENKGVAQGADLPDVEWHLVQAAWPQRRTQMYSTCKYIVKFPTP